MPSIEIIGFINIINLLQLNYKPSEVGIKHYMPLFKREIFKLVHFY